MASAYQLAGQAATNDPTLGQVLKPVWIQIDGPIDTVKKSYLTRRIEQARQERSTSCLFQINSAGGIDTAADGIADTIAGIKDMKTVAYLDDRALGVATLVALACNDIVFRKGARMGDVRQLVTGRHGQFQELSRARRSRAWPSGAANLAEQKGHPVAVAVAMVDPEAVVVEAKDTPHRGRRLRAPEPDRCGAGPLPEPGQVRKAAGRGLDRDRRGRRGLRAGAGGQRRRGLEGALRPARQDDPGGRADLGRFTGDGPDRPVRELAAAVHRPVHARPGAEAAGHRPAGDHARPWRSCCSSGATTSAARPTSSRSSCSWSAWSAWRWNCSSSPGSACSG